MTTQRLPVGKYLVDVCTGVGEERRSIEAGVAGSGIELALPHRSEWAQVMSPEHSLFFAVRNHGGAYQAGFGAQAAPSRALPAHRLLRVERLGYSGDCAALSAGLEALGTVARADRRMLRLYLEVFSPDPERRRIIEESARGVGFQSAMKPRSYFRTVLLDLSADVDSLFSSLPKKTRRDIRVSTRHPVEVRPVTDPSYQARMEALLHETLERTGGSYQQEDWSALIDLSNRFPALSRVAGLFRTDSPGVEALLAFAWGRHHGDHAEYATAASTRRTDLKIPLAYPLVWDLLQWAKQNGASYFDFGGISPGSHADDDPTGGISDFKRYFSTDVRDVGSEWVLEPSRLKAAAANAVSTTYEFIAGLRS